MRDYLMHNKKKTIIMELNHRKIRKNNETEDKWGKYLINAGGDRRKLIIPKVRRKTINKNKTRQQNEGRMKRKQPPDGNKSQVNDGANIYVFWPYGEARKDTKEKNSTERKKDEQE